METTEKQFEEKVTRAATSPNEDRLVMLSDGIFAIAATLLALDIKIPEASSENTLVASLQKDFSLQAIIFLITFFVICIYWLNHRYIMNAVKRIDAGFLWLNFLFLALIAFFPVTSNLIEVNGQYPEANIIYTAVVAGCGFVSALLWIYVSRRHNVIDSPLTRRNIRVRTILFLITPTFFLLSLLLILIPGFPPDRIYYTWTLTGILQYIVARRYRMKFLKEGEIFSHDGFAS